jgi:hypothetical protein
LIALDTLISDPPALLDSNLQAIGWLDTKTGMFSKLLPTALRPFGSAASGVHDRAACGHVGRA